ncbi:MAG: hypothetical protein FD124_3888, partial [Alphaproteobacteria bacterium]
FPIFSNSTSTRENKGRNQRPATTLARQGVAVSGKAKATKTGGTKS